MAAISSNVLVSSIQSEIQRVQDDLIGVEENLKRLTGRDFNEPSRGERRVRQISMGEREDEPPPKRRQPGGVFARLGEPVLEPPRARRVHEVLEDGELQKTKPSVASSVARPVNDGKSRTEAAAELTKDRASRDRNRRMFGALLGTLQRFRTEEAKQKGKDEQRAKIERKLEEKGRAEKEELRRERLELINQRKERQLRIEKLNFKIERVKEHEAWEAGQRRLGKFIRSQSKPSIFWLPKTNNSRTSSLVSQTKSAIERELEEARLHLKKELDEVLGGRTSFSVKADVEEREREVDNDYNNGSDLLDYDAEEGELVYDDLLLSGKQKGMGSERRVVVQVDSDVNRAPQRRVELVTVMAERKKRVKEMEENESEKENVIKSKINSDYKKMTENGGDKGKGKEKEKKNKEKDKSKGKEKGSDTKTSPEKHKKSHSSKDSSKKESKHLKKEKKREELEKKKELDSERQMEDLIKYVVEPSNIFDTAASDANAIIEEENGTLETGDLSQISLPLDPEPEITPKITEVVIQHVPLDGNDDNSQNANDDMQVETLLIDTSQIKQDKTEWDNNITHLPIVIKKEKDATPEKTEEKLEVTIKPREESGQLKKGDSSSESSNSDSDSSAESEDDDESSSSEDSSSESSSSDDEDDDRKKKRKEKDKGKNRRKDRSSSSESSGSDESDSESESSSSSSSEDERARKKKSGEKRKPSPKHSRRGERGRVSERKKEERKSGARKSKSRSKSKGRRSRSRDRKRVRSRSRDRRRDRR